MLSSVCVLAALGFWFGVVILVLLFKRLKNDPVLALHCATLFRRVFGR